MENFIFQPNNPFILGSHKTFQLRDRLHVSLLILSEFKQIN